MGSDKRGFEVRCRSIRWRRSAGRDSEDVDKFENEKAGKGAAEIGDAEDMVSGLEELVQGKSEPGRTWPGESCKCLR